MAQPPTYRELQARQQALEEVLRDALVRIYEKGGLQNHGHRTPETTCPDCRIVNRVEELLGYDPAPGGEP